MPALNAELIDGKLYRRPAVHLAFACDTDRGLLAPVIRNAQSLSLVELAARARELAAAATAGAIAADDLAGATFTVSNLGGLGIESFTPILNPPQVGILGVEAIRLQPVRRGGEVDFIDHIGLSLTCDHQVIDGAPGARFLAVLRQTYRERGEGMYDLIVIGAGPGGYEAAAHAGRMGKKVAVVERDRLGGTCLNAGCIPTKTLLRSSRLFAECRNAAAYGVRVPEGLAFDMAAVVERKNRIVGTLGKGVEGLLRVAGVDVIEGDAALLSRARRAGGRERVRGGQYPAGHRLASRRAAHPGHRFPGGCGFHRHPRHDRSPPRHRHHRRRVYRAGVRRLLLRRGRGGYGSGDVATDCRGLRW